MDLNTLRNADFKLLDDAVEDWARIVRNLADLAKDAEDGLHQAANKAEWAGVNSQVTREFIGKTAGEIKDAHTQAASIHSVLSDTAGELRGYQRQLDEVIDGGRKKNLTVLDTGNGSFTVTMNVHPDRAAAGHTPPSHSEADVNALRDEVQGILRKATESDNSANEILTALADQTNYGFGDASYKNRDQAAAALRAATELAALAGKKPGDLTVADFDRLNAGLATYANDPLFAEKFATTLGARGSLEFWEGLNDPHASARLGSSRVGEYDDLQRNLSMTLAQATQLDSAEMTGWKGQMIRLGDQQIGDWHGVTGFQVMSNLMRAGDYDDGFLKSYGTALMATERRLTGNGDHANTAWCQNGMEPLLNRMGDDNGHDPLTGYLKALSSSPDAATDFFNDQYVSKDESPFERDTDDNGKKGKVGLTNFQYLFEERDWPEAHEKTLEGDDVITGRNNLALALEAATTGHPAGEMPTADTPPHNAGQAKLFEEIVGSVSDDPKRLTGRSFMSDSTGQMAAEYMPDIHRGLDPGKKGETVLYPIAGAAADISQNDTTRFLYTVGRNPQGYAAVNLGQNSYTTQLMHHHFENLGLYPGDSHFSKMENLKKAVEDLSSTGAEIEGTIGAGRAYEAEVQGAAKDAQYNAVIDKVGTWGGSVVGIGVGFATAPIAGPGGEVAGDLAGTAADEIVGSITDGMMKDSSGDVIFRNGASLDGTAESTSLMVEKAAEKAGENTGHPSPMIVTAASTAAQQGFGNAQDNVHNAFDGEGVPRQLDKGD